MCVNVQWAHGATPEKAGGVEGDPFHVLFVRVTNVSDTKMWKIKKNCDFFVFFPVFFRLICCPPFVEYGRSGKPASYSFSVHRLVLYLHFLDLAQQNPCARPRFFRKLKKRHLACDIFMSKTVIS